MSANLSIMPQPALYRLSPDLVIEYFGEEAIILLTEQDILVTVNAAAAHLLELIRETFVERDFSLDELALFLRKRYDIMGTSACKEAQRLLSFALRQGMVFPAGDGFLRR